MGPHGDRWRDGRHGSELLHLAGSASPPPPWSPRQNVSQLHLPEHSNPQQPRPRPLPGCRSLVCPARLTRLRWSSSVWVEGELGPGPGSRGSSVPSPRAAGHQLSQLLAQQQPHLVLSHWGLLPGPGQSQALILGASRGGLWAERAWRAGGVPDSRLAPAPVSGAFPAAS